MKKIVISLLLVLTSLWLMGCSPNEAAQTPTPTPIKTSAPVPVVTPELKPTGPVTYEQFEQLKEGMSLSQVEDILGYGERGTVDGDYVVYTWDSTDYYVAIAFVSGKGAVSIRWIS